MYLPTLESRPPECERQLCPRQCGDSGISEPLSLCLFVRGLGTTVPTLQSASRNKQEGLLSL